MALETASYIGGLVSTNPTATDAKSQGDDHLRLIKTTLLNSFAGFPGLVVATGTEAQGSTVNDYTVTLSPAPAAYTTPLVVLFKATHANTGAATLQIGALGTKPLVAVDGGALKSGDIENGGIVCAYYDGTSFLLISGNDRANRNGDTYSGTHAFGSATVTVATQSASDNSTKAASTAYADAAVAAEASIRSAADTTLQSNINAKANIDSPTFTGTPAAPTAAAGTSTTQIATTAFVMAQAFSAALPAQTGNAGKFVTTNGTAASWADAVTPTGTQTLTNKTISYANNTLDGVQPTLVSGTNIKTVNGVSVLGAGDIAITPGVTADEASAIKANIAMNAFRIAALGSYSFMKMVDGVADDYVDQTGVALASGYLYASSTKSYDAGPSYIAAGGSGDRTSSITVTTNLATTEGVLSSLVDGSTSSGNGVWFTYDSNISGNWVTFDFGAGNAKSIGAAKVYAYESTTRGFWKWQGSNDNSTWTDVSASEQILNGAKEWAFTDSTAYRYFRIAGVSGGIDAAGGITNGWREVEFKIGAVGAAALIANAVTALATPSSAQVILWEEDLASLTLNTDLQAWVTRESGKTFTTTFSTSTTAINSTAHGFTNGDRVMLLSSSALPTGLSAAVVYYVVSAATDSFSVSLTSGGSAVAFSSNGSGTHTAREVAQVTLVEEAVLTTGGRILSGSADISAQASGTSVRYAIVAPTSTANRMHAASIQWK